MNTNKYIFSFIYLGIVLYMTLELGWAFTLFFSTISLAQVYIVINKVKLISNMTINFIALSGIALILFNLEFSDSVLIFFAIILFASQLKILQSHSKETISQLCILNFFTFNCLFIFSQSIYLAIIVFTLIFINLCVLNGSFNQNSIKKSMARFYKLYLFLFPVSILFLIFVPKLNSFWTLPSPNIAKTGLSESVDPFKINELSQSDDLAFRVIFNNTSKNNFPMYWRTIIHDKFDGSQWHVSNGQSQFLKTKHTRSNFTYTIIAEPSNLPWLYGLNDSYSPSPNIQTNVHGTLINTKGNYKKIEYKVNTLKKKSIVLSRYEHINNTYVPNNSNPKMQALSKELAQGSQNVGEYIIKMKQFFLDNNFVYSLTPPNLSSNNPIDEFLFDTNIGFCGHYASSAAALLRTAGIPARLVSGYLGGELNSDGYYTVYQYDAHAWVEYYSQNYGWRRLDPTAWVSPDRLLGSLSQVEDLNDDFNEYMGLSLVRFSNIRVISWVRRQLETLDYNWTRSVLNFNKEKQENLLVKLFGNHSNLFPGLFIIVFFLICILTYYILVNYKQRDKQPLIVMYFKLLISHLPDYSSDMTPHQIITQLKTKYPTKVEQLSQFYRLYAKNRYQEIHLNKVSLQSCKDLISDLNKIDKKTPI